LDNIKAVCVYCGSSSSVSDSYKDAARRLGQEFVKHDVRLVYGGGDVGLMGLIADSVMDNGGKVTGYIPQYLNEFEKGHTGISELFVVDSMHERKRLMFERSDAFVILPGGFGTLDEICEIITWRQLRLHSKPVVFVNINNYWSALFDTFVDHMIAEKFVRPEHKKFYMIVDNVEDVLPTLEANCQPGVPDFVSRVAET
jgi:uncharacterized protein (TIGR00730 family)